VPASRPDFSARLATLAVAVALLACKKKPAGEGSYWTSGCIPRSREDLVLFGGDELVRLDLSSGALGERTAGHHDELGCFPDGTFREVKGARVVGSTSRAEVVTFRVFDDLTHWDRASVNERGGGVRNLDMEARLFPEIGSGAPSVLDVRAVGLVEDDTLVVAAAYEPTTVSGRSATPRSLGFFRIALASGAASVWSPPLASNEVVHPHYAKRYAIARNGSFLLGVFGTENDLKSVGFRATAEETFRVPIEGAWEIERLAVSYDGKRAAIGVTLPGGSTCRVDVLETETGKVTQSWPATPAKGRVQFLEFLANGSLVLGTSDRRAARLAPDGTVVWSVPPQ
jgi:hypothetical protein